MSIDAEHAASLRSGLLGQLAAEHQTTLSVIRHVPDDKLEYKVHPQMRSFAVLALHIYRGGTWFANIMENGQFQPGSEDMTTRLAKSELLGQCETLNREFANRVNALAPEALSRIIEFPGAGPFAAVVFLGWHLNHMIHHRGQLSIYLRLMGAKVPQIYGPTIDYP